MMKSGKKLPAPVIRAEQLASKTPHITPSPSPYPNQSTRVEIASIVELDENEEEDENGITYKGTSPSPSHTNSSMSPAPPPVNKKGEPLFRPDSGDESSSNAKSVPFLYIQSQRLGLLIVNLM